MKPLSKPTFYTIIIFLLSTPAWSQENWRDSIIQYALSHERPFWQQVSAFYPLSHHQIDQYREQLNFWVLSSNEYIDWTDALVERYRNEWYPDLIRNPSIQWDQPRIDKFKDAPWFDWHAVAEQSPVVLSKPFVAKHRRSLQHENVSFSETGSDSILLSGHSPISAHPALINELLIKSNWRSRVPAWLLLKKDSIHAIPPDTLLSYAAWIDRCKLSTTENYPWSAASFAKLFPILNTACFFKNKALYKAVLEKTLSDSLLDSIYKFHIGAAEPRYYFMQEGSDEFGLLPQVEFQEKSSLPFNQYFDMIDTLPDQLPEASFVIGTTFDPPKRFADFMPLDVFESTGPLSVCFVSPRAQALLSTHVLPPHRFFPVTIRMEDPLYGRDSMLYYMFLLDQSPTDQLDKNRLQLVHRRDMVKQTLNITDSAYITFANQNMNYRQFLDSQKKSTAFKIVDVSGLFLEKYYDLFSLSGGVFYVSHRLVKALRDLQISGVYIDVFANSPVVRISSDKIPAAQPGNTSMVPNVNPLHNQTTVRNYKMAMAIRDSILIAPPVVASLYRDRPQRPYDIDEQELRSRDSLLREMEITWDVLLPEKFRLALVHRTLPYFGQELAGYEIYDLNRISQLHTKWSDQHPATVKGLEIGRNSSDSSLILVLTPGSTHQLSGIIYKSGIDGTGLAPVLDVEERLE